MTPSTKPVTRLTSAYARNRGFRPIVATLHGSVLILRCKGMRCSETLDISWAYLEAVKQRVAREKAEKRNRKKR